MSTSDLTRPERVAIARLQAMLELLPTALDRELSCEGLTAFEFSLIEALAEADDHRLRLSALAARTNASLPRLSRVVTGLERKGLVERTPCPADARATNAVLTPQGLDAFHRTQPLHASAVRSMVLQGLDADDVAELARLTLAILTRLDPDGRLPVTTETGSTGTAGPSCPADPPYAAGVRRNDPPACPADPAS